MAEATSEKPTKIVDASADRIIRFGENRSAIARVCESNLHFSPCILDNDFLLKMFHNFRLIYFGSKWFLPGWLGFCSLCCD
jgi:hypothetical protein